MITGLFNYLYVMIPYFIIETLKILLISPMNGGRINEGSLNTLGLESNKTYN